MLPSISESDMQLNQFCHRNACVCYHQSSICINSLIKFFFRFHPLQLRFYRDRNEVFFGQNSNTIAEPQNLSVFHIWFTLRFCQSNRFPSRLNFAFMKSNTCKSLVVHYYERHLQSSCGKSRMLANSFIWNFQSIVIPFDLITKQS